MKKILNSKVLFRVITLLFVAIALFSAFMILKSLLEYKKGADTYKELHQFITFPEPANPTHNSKNPNQQKSRWPKVDFESLWEINPDIVAWIYCEGTAINYPIVQAGDNEYYLRRLLDGTWNIAGSLFMDYSNTPTLEDKNTIIYGHNLKDKSMFWSVAKYRNQEYYDAHPTMLLITPENNYEIQLFSGYVADPEVYQETWITSFSNDQQLENWLEKTQQRSVFSSPVIPTTEDHFITLSTCSDEWDDARYVVVGRLDSGAQG